MRYNRLITMVLRAKSSWLRPCLFSLFILLASCGGEKKKKEKEGSGPTILEGKFDEASKGQVRLKERKGVFTYEERVVAESPIQDGRFRLSFDPDSLGYVSFQEPNGSILLHLRPGDSLFVRKGPRGGYSFEGKGSARNEYIQKRKLFHDSLKGGADTLFNSGKKAFKRALEERKKAFRAFRRKHFEAGSSPGLGERFQKLERMRDHIDLAILNFSYPDIYRYENPNDTVEFTDAHWAFLDSMDLNDPLLLKVPEFLSFAYDVANKYALENRREEQEMGYAEILFRTIREEFEGKVRDALMTYFILERKRYAPKGVEGSFLDRYKDSVRDPRMRSYVEKKLQNEGEQTI